MIKSQYKSSVKTVCNRIELLAESLKDTQHQLLYEQTMQELHCLNFNSVFDKITGLTLHRIRLNDETDYLFDKVKDLYYPEPEFVKNYGRVNTPSQSMFYCSEFHGICELELLHDYLLNNAIGHERLATYSEWEIKKELSLLILTVAPLYHEITNGFKIRKQCFEFIKSEPTSTIKGYRNHFELTQKYFLKDAKSDKNTYVICSAIANLFTMHYPEIDGFIFPSVQGVNGYNIVLRPHVLNNKMILPNREVTMKRWLVSNKNNMSIDPTYSNKGYIDGEKIIWEN